MPDRDIINEIKALPNDATLTQMQIAELGENITLVLEKTLPAKAMSARGSVQDVVKLFQSDPRFRFIDQVPGAQAKIEQYLRPYGATLMEP